MNYELVMKYGRGEMPAECYRVPNTEDELVKIIEELQSGMTISADTPHGSGFGFGRTASGRWAFLTDEYLDADETNPNPDFRQSNFDTVADGVRQFTINGKGLFEAVKGCRFMLNDFPIRFDDVEV